MNQKPGRNDPCYCGSGLKYKKCHLRADQEEERERREMLEAGRYLRRDLIAFARDERFATSFGKALPLYWNEYYTIENADEMSENEALRFFDWFAFDYQDPEDGGRLIDVYRRERWEELSSQQQAVLGQWKDAGPTAAYVLEDYESQTLHLRDFMTGEEYEVFEPAGHGAAEVGDLILARLLPVQDHLEFSNAAAYIPEDEIEGLRQELEAARAADREAYPEATVAEFMRRHNHLLVHHALAQAEKNGRPPVAALGEE